MKKITLFSSVLLVVIVTTLMSTGCVNNKKELLLACDSVNVKYSSDIKQIIENNCNNCHANDNYSNFGGGYKLGSYDDLIMQVDTTSGSNGGSLLFDVKVGRMPKGRSKLTDCEIAKIEKWIKDGALNN